MGLTSNIFGWKRDGVQYHTAEYAHVDIKTGLVVIKDSHDPVESWGDIKCLTNVEYCIISDVLYVKGVEHTWDQRYTYNCYSRIASYKYKVYKSEVKKYGFPEGSLIQNFKRRRWYYLFLGKQTIPFVYDSEKVPDNWVDFIPCLKTKEFNFCMHPFKIQE